MDYRKFDRLTQRVSVAGSRRQALRAVLGAALVGTVTGGAAAKPKHKAVKPGKRVCDDKSCQSVYQGKCCPGNFCSCGKDQQCCNNRCFWDSATDPNEEFCCTGPEWVICGEGQDAKCCRYDAENPCSCLGPGAITGSYRRR
jgi:hypothetical protein